MSPTGNDSIANSTPNLYQLNVHPRSNQFHGVEHRIFKESWMNKNLASSSNNWGVYYNWKLVRVVIEDGTLKLFRPPTEVNIKYFDSNCPIATQLPAQRRKSLATGSLAHSKSSFLTDPKLFFQGSDPHPELEYNERGCIVGGTDEAICHTILFGHSNEFAQKSTLLLPLLTDLVSALEIFALYSSNASGLSSIYQSQLGIHPNAFFAAIVLRLKMVVETIKDQLSGLLLERDIYAALRKLVESIGCHDKNLAKVLELHVATKHKQMTDMLSFNTHQESSIWSGLQPKIKYKLSDKLHFILSSVETSSSTNQSSTSTNHHYTNVNSVVPISMTTTQLPGAIPPDLILELDIEMFAKQIYRFHLSFYKDWSPTADVSLLFNHVIAYNIRNPLVFDSTKLHFLGAMLVDHLFNKIHCIDDQYRAKILQYWVTLGNILKNCGDMVGWLSIATVICSISILRLRNVWYFVPGEIKEYVVREWAPVVFDLEHRLITSNPSRKSSNHVLVPQGIGVSYPKERVVPYFGDLCIRIEERPTYKQCENLLKSIQTSFDRWEAFLDQVAQTDVFEPLPDSIPIIQNMLYALLSHHAQIPSVSIENVLEMSLDTYPCICDDYASNFYTQNSLISLGEYYPILFTEVINTFSLISKLDITNLTFSESNKRNIKVGGINHLMEHSFIGKELSITGFPNLDYNIRSNISVIVSQDPIIKSFEKVSGLRASLFHVGNEVIFKTFQQQIHEKNTNISLSCADIRRWDLVKCIGNIHSELSTQRAGAEIFVTVQAASLSRLIDFLVIGSHEFSHFTCVPRLENPLFTIDGDLYRRIFLFSFRSFCSPITLLEELVQRFVGAKSAAHSISEIHRRLDISMKVPDVPGTLESFPNWNSICEEDPVDIDWLIVAHIQMNVLNTCYYWISQHFIDFSSSIQIRDKFISSLNIFELELQHWKEPGAPTTSDFHSCYESIMSLYRKLRKIFVRKSYRPLEMSQLATRSITCGKYGVLPPVHITEALFVFIEEINNIVADFFFSVQFSDWLEYFEILEYHSRSNCGLFHYKPPNITNEEDIGIQNIYTYLESLLRDDDGNKLIEIFPKSIRDLIQLHKNLTDYFVFQLCDPQIEKNERVNRMISVLKLLAICRKIDLESQNASYISKEGVIQHKPSFLETALAYAVISPESRSYSSGWVIASQKLTNSDEIWSENTVANIESIIPNMDIPVQNEPFKPLIPCVGWMSDLLLELVCFIPNLSPENSSLINFSKFEYCYDLLSSFDELKRSTVFTGKGTKPYIDTSLLNKYAYLVNPSKNLFQLDRKVVKDASVKENKEFPRSLSKIKVFTDIVQKEIEKQKRDSRQRETIETKTPKKLGLFKQTLASNNIQQEKKNVKTSKFGGFLKAVRPISNALTSGLTQSTDKVVNPENLPNLATLSASRFKLISSIDLTATEILSTSLNKENHTIKMCFDDAPDLILQAVSDSAADGWIHTINTVRKQSILAKMLSPGFTQVFGVPIEILCEREMSALPHAVDLLLSEIETRGLEEVGLYRIPGSLASVNALKTAFDSGEEIDMSDERWFDINTVAGCFKLYLRELPEPLLTNELIGEFILCGSLDNSKDPVPLLRRVVHSLPSVNYYLLKRIIIHLVKVAKFGSTNLMHAVNLAIVFSMSFLPPSSSTSSVSSDLGAMQTILKNMIQSYEQIFSDIQEDDMEGPLPSQLLTSSNAHHLGLGADLIQEPQS